jgi:hypothetical protein
MTKFLLGALRRAFLFGEEFEVGMTKAKGKAKGAPVKRGHSSGKSRKPVDLQAVREQISNLVGGEAVGMVETTIGEVGKGHYGAMKYLFEMVGLYPGEDGETAPEGEDVLAATLLKRLGLPEDVAPKPAVPKDNATPAGQGDAVE